MPFTLAHATAALPLRRTRLIPSAVLIGCLVPDFEYFVRLAPRTGGGHTFSHTLAGLFVIDLPLGIAIFWLFHRYAKQSLWTWLPRAIRERVNLKPSALAFKSAPQSALVLASVFVGAGTHILWDSFCHASYWPARHLRFLHYSVLLPNSELVQIYTLFQMASSFLGTVVLLIWIAYHLNRAPINSRKVDNAKVQRRRDLMIVFAVALIGGALRALHGLRPQSSSHRLEVFIAEAAVTAITLFLVQSIIFGFLREKTESPTQTA